MMSLTMIIGLLGCGITVVAVVLAVYFFVREREL